MPVKLQSFEEIIKSAYPLELIRKGYYTDAYFVRARDILKRDRRNPRVVMQVFAKKRSVFCGAQEASVIIRECANPGTNLKLWALPEGEWFKPHETVMTIEGPYRSFAHLETVYLGILSRRTAVATLVRRVAGAARDKPVLFFAARFDHFLCQEGDGYAAMIGGAASVSTDANGAWIGQMGMGTIPHALIAAYDGDTIAATKAFDRHIPGEVGRIALVDFENDCPKTAVAVARALGRRLWGVRLDTSESLIDETLRRKGILRKGVCSELVREVRNALDMEGFEHVRIVVSGGFTERRIRKFMRENVPVDAFGVGSFMYSKRVDFTADIVRVDGESVSKVGRKYNPNPRLVEY